MIKAVPAKVLIGFVILFVGLACFNTTLSKTGPTAKSLPLLHDLRRAKTFEVLYSTAQSVGSPGPQKMIKPETCVP